MIRTVAATRYVTPLREGGSVPAIVEADDDGMYVVKFRGAGQGPKALIAELIAGEIGRTLGLPVPEIVLIEIDPILSRAEPDPEIQHILRASGGLNVALDYLPGSLPFTPAVGPRPDPMLAAKIVWFDAFVTNVDRTVKNPNLLIWHRNLWLIDHGAALYVHHTWTDPETRSRSPFPQVAHHILLPFAGPISEIDTEMRRKLTQEFFGSIVEMIPESWLEDSSGIDPVSRKQDYLDYLVRRLQAADIWVDEAEHSRSGHANARPI